MIEYYVPTILSAAFALVVAKFVLPYFIKLLRLDNQVLTIGQGILISYALLVGLIIPMAHFVWPLYHFVTPF